MNYKLDKIQTTVATGLDAFFQSESQIVTPINPAPVVAKTAAAKGRVKVGSLAQLNGFERVSSETLIQKATKDLWTIKREGNDYYIERLFEDNGDPLKV